MTLTNVSNGGMKGTSPAPRTAANEQDAARRAGDCYKDVLADAAKSFRRPARTSLPASGPQPYRAHVYATT